MNILVTNVSTLISSHRDTLQNQLSHLAHQLDSLNKITSRNTIATEFFHDIINVNVATFVGIITLVIGVTAVISWTTVVQKFKREREILENAFNTRLATHETTFTSRIVQHDSHIKKLTDELQEQAQSLKSQGNEQKRDFFSAMFVATLTANVHEHVIKWGLRLALANFQLDDKTEALSFLETVRGIANKHKLTMQKESLMSVIESIKESFELIRKISPDGREIVTEIETVVFQIIYQP
jgi:hypothetical protein